MHHLESGGVERVEDTLRSMPARFSMIEHPSSFRPSLDYYAMQKELVASLPFDDLQPIEVGDARRIFDLHLEDLTEDELSAVSKMQRSAIAHLLGRDGSNQWVWLVMWVTRHDDQIAELNDLLERSLTRRQERGVRQGVAVDVEPVVTSLDWHGAELAKRAVYHFKGDANEIPVVVYRVGVDRVLIEIVFRDYEVSEETVRSVFTRFISSYSDAVASLESQNAN